MSAAREQSIEPPTASDRFLSLPTAAAAIKKSRSTVLSLIITGELTGEMIAGRMCVTRESVQQYREKHGIKDEPSGKENAQPRRKLRR